MSDATIQVNDELIHINNEVPPDQAFKLVDRHLLCARSLRLIRRDPLAYYPPWKAPEHQDQKRLPLFFDRSKRD